MLKDKYDVVFLSNSLSAKVSASFFAKKNAKILLIDKKSKELTNYKNFNVYNYELPYFFTNSKSYLNDAFSFLGLKKINKFITNKTPLSIVFGKKRLHFHELFITEDVTREFGDVKNNVLSFLDEIRIINSKLPPLWLNDVSYPSKNVFDSYNFISRSDISIYKYLNKDIDYLYKKFKLPNYIASLFNTIIFFASGVNAKNYLAISSIRILAQVLGGVNSFVGDKLHLEQEVNKILKSKIDIRKDVDVSEIIKKRFTYRLKLDCFEAYVRSKYIVTDYDNINYSKLNAYTMNIYIKKEYIPSSLGEFTLYIDTDKSNWFDLSNVFVLRIVKKNDHGVLVLSSFVNDTLSSTNLREKYLVMYEAVKNLIPFIAEGTLDMYPDIFNEDFIKNEDITICDFIFNEKTKIKYRKKKNIYYCGRTIMPSFGVEGDIISALKVSDFLLRKTQWNY